MERSDVLLINMPFGALFRPSIGLTLLKASLLPLKIHARILYYTIRFAEQIGTSFYMQMVNEAPVLTALSGEWIFARGLFGDAAPPEENYIEEVLRQQLPEYQHLYLQKRCVSESFIEAARNARSKVEPFLAECLQEVLARSPFLVGFTTAFQQNISSLALAKRIKENAPEIFIVFGGANCEGIMGAELIRQFPFIDAVVSGEGDLVFPDLVRRIREGKPLADLNGVRFTGGLDQDQNQNAPMVHNMDSLPFVNYDDFTQQILSSRLDHLYRPRLLFESARGCWWGERNHCTFCGLNADTMIYRSKSSERALAEISFLAKKYPGLPISITDNILNVKYFKDFLPRLASKDLNLDLFYEVKANLKKEHLRILRQAGIRTIQPGIESFSNRVLQIMRKGVKALQNIQLLKWCKEFGIHPFWNLIWGFPGESPEEYERMAELVPLLTHFTPPEYATQIRMDRFSPNFEFAQDLGFRKPKPAAGYRHIYPFPPAVLENLAFYFTFEYQEPRDVIAYTKPLWEQVQLWKENHSTAELSFVDHGTELIIHDSRKVAKNSQTVLTGITRDLYLCCDSAITMEVDSEKLLQPLLEKGLMIRDGNLFLSLAIPSMAPGS